jgi:hypothetical protein
MSAFVKHYISIVDGDYRDCEIAGSDFIISDDLSDLDKFRRIFIREIFNELCLKSEYSDESFVSFIRTFPEFEFPDSVNNFYRHVEIRYRSDDSSSDDSDFSDEEEDEL